MDHAPEGSYANQRLILVMGLTGAGKSSFINLFPVNPKLQVSSIGELDCCTQQIARVGFHHDGLDVTMVDTVGSDHLDEGYDDDDDEEEERDEPEGKARDDGDAIKKLVAFVKTRSDEGQQVSGIIYLHRISDNRMAATAIEIFLTNHWAPLSDASRRAHEANEHTLKTRVIKSRVRAADAIRFERLDDAGPPSEQRAIEILRPLLTSPLDAPLQVVNQYRHATDEHRLAATDLGKVVDKQYEKKALRIERDTGMRADIVRKAQASFRNTTDEDMKYFAFAVEVSQRLFDPYTGRTFGLVMGMGAGVFGELLMRFGSTFEAPGSGGTLRREQKRLWKEVEMKAEKYGKSGAELGFVPTEMGGTVGVLTGACLGIAQSFGKGCLLLCKSWEKKLEEYEAVPNDR